MTAEGINKAFGPKHHALLFAWMSREVIQRAGVDKGEKVIRKAVQRYGSQRGKRMALRAQADNQPLSMFNFLLYSERESNEEDSDHRVLETAPHFHTLVTRCPWNQAWVETDLRSFGRLYCLEVDHALIEGFNPELDLELNATLSNGQRACDFIYQDANLTPENQYLMAQRREEIYNRVVMPWDYHLGHLLKTISEVVIEELGDLGKETVEAAMAAFAGEFGEGAAQIVKGFETVDFDKLP